MGRSASRKAHDGADRHDEADQHFLKTKTEAKIGGQDTLVPGGAAEHQILAQAHLRVVLAKHRRIAPVAGGLEPVEQAGLGQHQRARADRGDECALVVHALQPGAFTGKEAARRTVDRLGHVADDDDVGRIDSKAASGSTGTRP